MTNENDPAANRAFMDAASQIARTVATRDEFDRGIRPILKAISLHGYTDKDALREMRLQARRVFHAVHTIKAECQMTDKTHQPIPKTTAMDGMRDHAPDTPMRTEMTLNHIADGIATWQEKYEAAESLGYCDGVGGSEWSHALAAFVTGLVDSIENDEASL